ncbi:DUF1659 domain-containing protein [Lysinibacillus endophyticus]|mgnify:FL=1|uniref:DUF1659 domain-containing protein n=1 Tax=Ureibacillus endophyticus TaxID=1978490 RepID=A0A494YWC1_9BACL|nr:DUF1659 domain-containing protein [Lysinibacillus endophyticus]MCP1144953.1 DUF1659 domain-containing protein [Lysinibacillus endophyticus]RKQ14452.1 DUF1659 domain-containing protein [Lysinibacillus endophyticus]
MAAYTFESASLKLVFETGMDEFGKPIFSSKTYQNVRPNVQPEQLFAVVQAIASLCQDPLNDMKRIVTETVNQ